MSHQYYSRLSVKINYLWNDKDIRSAPRQWTRNANVAHVWRKGELTGLALDKNTRGYGAEISLPQTIPNTCGVFRKLFWRAAHFK